MLVGKEVLEMRNRKTQKKQVENFTQKMMISTILLQFSKKIFNYILIIHLKGNQLDGLLHTIIQV